MIDLDAFKRAFPQESCQRVAVELVDSRRDVVTWKRMYEQSQEEIARLKRLLSPPVTPSPTIRPSHPRQEAV